MDKIKDPAIVLSGGTALGLLGMSYYFYTQNVELKEEMEALKTTLATLQTKMQSIEKDENSQKRKIDAISRKNEEIFDILEESELIVSRRDEEESARSNRSSKRIPARKVMKQTTSPDSDGEIDFASIMATKS